MPRRVLIAPSVLSADFGHLARATRAVAEMGGDFVHLDVMDGHFVPNLTFGPKAVADLRPVTPLPFDVHLMIEHPERWTDRFIDAGADWLTIHLEAAVHAQRTLCAIRGRGKRPGVSIVPATPAEALSEVLDDVDLVLVMTVNPGFGGQPLIPRTLRKVETLAGVRAARHLAFLIEVDGGINRDTARSAIEAGADILVTGSAVFEAEDPAREVAFLRGEWYHRCSRDPSEGRDPRKGGECS
jgi:ribulose-phosphate 3-epimerase